MRRMRCTPQVVLRSCLLRDPERSVSSPLRRSATACKRPLVRLSPLMQWVLVPPLVVWIARRQILGQEFLDH